MVDTTLSAHLTENIHVLPHWIPQLIHHIHHSLINLIPSIDVKNPDEKYDPQVNKIIQDLDWILKTWNYQNFWELLKKFSVESIRKLNFTHHLANLNITPIEFEAKKFQIIACFKVLKEYYSDASSLEVIKLCRSFFARLYQLQTIPEKYIIGTKWQPDQINPRYSELEEMVIAILCAKTNKPLPL